MTTVSRIIQPRDPIICRDGRPFDAGLRGRSLDWPYPSVVIGTARTSLIDPTAFHADGSISPELAQQLLTVSQRGPLPAWREGNGPWQLAFPAPADVLTEHIPAPENSGEQAKIKLHPLRPASLTDGDGVDVPDGFTEPWRPAMAARPPKGKPPKGLPRFWKHGTFLRWLGHAGSETVEFDAGRDGVKAPQRELRTHVSINPASQTAEDGALFSTEGLDFGRNVDEDLRSDAPELALASDFLLPDGFRGDRLLGLIPVGGERRMAVWQESSALLDSFRPGDLTRRVLESRRLRLVLLTPAWFTHGWLAEWMRVQRLPLPDGSTLALKLVSATVPRFAAISGWDLLHRQPKPTRFLAPAGSVYFFELEGDATEKQIEQLWLQPVGEEPETGRSLATDGFGLAAYGVWNDSKS